VLAKERVIRAARDRVGVERRLPAPALEGTDRALAEQVRDDQRAVDTLRRKELVLGKRLEAWEPFVVEAVARRESVGGEITETMIVGVDPRDAGRDGIERVTRMDEVVGVLAEARELERLPAARAELRVARVRPSAVAAIDARAGGGGRSRRRRASGDGSGFVIRRFVAEAAHAFAQLAENVRQLPRPEDDQHYREDEEKLGTTNTRHRSLPREACSNAPRSSSVRMSSGE
jgi:hypothetical protein